jgi:hypothetical protein
MTRARFVVKVFPRDLTSGLFLFTPSYSTTPKALESVIFSLLAEGEALHTSLENRPAFSVNRQDSLCPIREKRLSQLSTVSESIL